jgi:hypothetical protein
MKPYLWNLLREDCVWGVCKCARKRTYFFFLMLFTLQAIASSSMGEEEMLSEGKLQETNVVAVEVERWVEE